MKSNKQRVIDLFKKQKGKILYFSDICDTLKLDLRTVVPICRELLAEGKIRNKKGV